jgi:glycosyltransferase involved in cell wall biosynthesis
MENAAPPADAPATTGRRMHLTSSLLRHAPTHLDRIAADSTRLADWATSSNASAAVKPVRVVHVISGLSMNGAELMLYRLVTSMRLRGFDPRVVVLGDDGPVGTMLRAAGVPVVTLDMHLPYPSVPALLRLRDEILQADVVQSWMYHSDFAAGLARAMIRPRRRPPLAWGIRNGRFCPASSNRLTMRIARICAILSSLLPTVIVCCADSAREFHERLGYSRHKIRVIPNGCDVDLFAPAPERRRGVREALGIDADAKVVGRVGRFDPQKDHRTFFRAASVVASRCPGVRFVLCGTGITADNHQLREWSDAAGVSDRTLMLGSRTDIAAITGALDVAVSSSSYGEGFPNVLVEAMACGVPCVATDAGDSATIVGDTGWVVAGRDHTELAAAILRVLAMDRLAWTALGNKARSRVVAHFSVHAAVERYAALYNGLMTSRRRRD